MPPTILGLTLVSFISLAAVSNAVTVVSNSVLSSTNVAGNVDNTPPTSQSLPNSGSINAVATSPAAADLGGGSWEFNGLSLASISAVRGSSGANTGVVASAQAAYEIIFTLGTGDPRELTRGSLLRPRRPMRLSSPWEPGRPRTSFSTWATVSPKAV